MKNFDHNIGFWEKRQFFAENCQKSQKIVIITSTPGVLATASIECVRKYFCALVVAWLDNQWKEVSSDVGSQIGVE
jgi:hypothetical protein